MSKPVPYVPITDKATYDEIVWSVMDWLTPQLHTIHRGIARDHNTTDAGPMLSGALGAVMQFIFDTGGDWAPTREALILQMDTLAPQMEMARTERRRSANDAGTA
jgi:hypothetical protein